MSDEHHLLRLREVAAELGVSRRTAYRWAASGRLPVVRHGRRGTWVPRAALDAFMRAEAEAAIDNLEGR